MLLEGRVVDELEPTEAIPDLDKGTRNAHGLVDYAARISLIIPMNPADGNGALLIDIPNRGRPCAQALYNSPRDEPFESGPRGRYGISSRSGVRDGLGALGVGQGADLPSFIDSAGTKRFVEGVGFAIVRDTADFLSHGSADSTSSENPLHGVIKRTLADGKSQSGRYLKSFLLSGFNVIDGHRVFAGMHVFVSGAGLLPIMQSGAGPQSSATRTPGFDDPEFRGVNEDILTIGDLIKRVKARGENPPKMILINSTTDYFSLRASLSRTGAEGATEQPIPDNVRTYEIAGGSHVVVPKAECTLPPAKLDWSPVSRATLLHLDNWVAKGHRATRQPSDAARGEQERSHGAAGAGALPNAIIEVPKRDADGNATGGVRLPDMRHRSAPTRSRTRLCRFCARWRGLCGVSPDPGRCRHSP